MIMRYNTNQIYNARKVTPKCESEAQKCESEINEQHIYGAPAITLHDHRVASNAR